MTVHGRSDLTAQLQSTCVGLPQVHGPEAAVRPRLLPSLHQRQTAYMYAPTHFLSFTSPRTAAIPDVELVTHSRLTSYIAVHIQPSM